MANFDKALNIADKKLFSRQFTSDGVENFKKGLHHINKGKYSDPTFLGFTLLFDWQSPLLSADDFGDTALGYLKRTGEVERLEMLKNFQKILQTVNKEMPWYWQSIEGLQRAWEVLTDFTDPFRGGRDSLIEISTLESIDLRMTSILSLYRKIAFDSKNRRQILPSNLKKFALKIHIKEIRNFNTVLNAVDKLSELGVPANASLGETSGFFDGSNNKAVNFMRENSRETAKVVNDNTSTIIYTFSGCEIDPTKGSEILSGVSNSESAVAKSKFSFTYNDVEEHSNFALLDFIIEDFNNAVDESSLTFEDKIKNRMENLGKEFGRNQGERLVNSAEQFARAKMNNLILGNVYGKVVGSSAVNALARGTIDGTVRDISAERSLIDRIKIDG